MTKKKTHGNYPAVEAIINTAVEGSVVDFDTACRIESRYFTSLATGNWNNVDTWVAIARTGTITATTASPTVTGVGTLFLSEIAPGDKIFASNGTTLIGTVLSIGSNTSLTLTANASNAITAAAFTARKVPGTSDAVTIASGHTVTVTATANCTSVSFLAASSNTSTLSINSGITLNVSGAVTIPRQGTNINTMAVGAGILNAGSIAFTDGGGGQRHVLTISTGTVTVTGNVTQSGSTGSATITFTGSGLLKLGGTFLTFGTGTFTASTGTVEYNAGVAQIVGDFTYNNLTLSNAGAKTVTGVTVNGKLSMQGTATATVAPTYGAAATLEYNTATSRTAGAEWITTFLGTGGVIIDNTGTITLNAAKQFGNNTNVPLNIKTGATLSTSGSNFGLTFHGNFINAGTLSAGSSAITIGGTVAVQSIAGFTTTGTVSITKTAGTATLTGAVNGGAFILNGNGGTLNTGGNNITGTGTLTLTNNAIITLGGSPHTISFANSSGSVWGAGITLTINGWAGAYDGTAGTGGRIFIGTTSGGLIAGQLAKIQFFNGSTNFSATILSDGEVVPFTPPPSGLSYTTPNTFIEGVAITNLNPTVTGPVASYSVSPALPAGLNLNTTTGVISGTPTTPTATNTYTVTATNIGGSTSFGVVIKIFAW